MESSVRALKKSLIRAFIGEELLACILHFLFLHLLVSHSHGIKIESKLPLMESLVNTAKEELSNSTKLLSSDYL